MSSTEHYRESRPKVVISWSSGKDSCFALMEILRSGNYDVTGLITTVTSEYGRVSMHGIRERLLDRQAEELGLPLTRVEIPARCTNEFYESLMEEAIERLRTAGTDYVAYGDLYLEDVRKYREERMRASGIEPLFPIWGRSTSKLAEEIISSGIRAKIVCLDPRKVSRSLAGMDYDYGLLSALPDGVDPCGENGEFHTFVYAAPIYRNGEIHVKEGATVERDGFVFTDFDLP